MNAQLSSYSNFYQPTEIISRKQRRIRRKPRQDVPVFYVFSAWHAGCYTGSYAVH